MGKDERINEIKGKATEAAKKAQEAASKAAGKANKLYNKLPLDKINEKLGGKIDIKSKKFKIAAGIIVVLLLLLLKGLFFSDSLMKTDQKTFGKKAEENIKIIYALNDSDLREYWIANLIVIDKKKEEPGMYYPIVKTGKTPMECVALVKIHGPLAKEYTTRYSNMSKKISPVSKIRQDLKDAVLKIHQKQHDAEELEKVRDGRRKQIESDGPEALNKQLDETYDTCTKIVVKDCFYSVPDSQTTKASEWYHAIIYLRNSKTGKTKERAGEVMYAVAKGSFIITLTKNRPNPNW